jgi:hypothetical protein
MQVEAPWQVGLVNRCNIYTFVQLPTDGSGEIRRNTRDFVKDERGKRIESI